MKNYDRKLVKKLTNSRPMPLEAPCTIETPPSQRTDENALVIDLLTYVIAMKFCW